MNIIGYLLAGIHLFLLVWAVGGILEMILPEVFWKPFTNPLFPDWVLVIHWGSVLIAAVSFLYGYFTYWDKTPHIMAVAYGFMAMVCVIETFGYMTSDLKFVAMGAEFIAYIVVLLILFRSSYFVEYFSV